MSQPNQQRGIFVDVFSVACRTAPIAPTPGSEQLSNNPLEDTALHVSFATLLANDTDVDVATDGQTLSISAVSNASNGTVSILGNGQIQFIPTATVLVGSTDDAPVASGETVNMSGLRMLRFTKFLICLMDRVGQLNDTRPLLICQMAVRLPHSSATYTQHGHDRNSPMTQQIHRIPSPLESFSHSAITESFAARHQATHITTALA